MTPADFEEFVGAYLACMLWSSTDEDDPLDMNYSVHDIDAASVEEQREECRAFCEEFSDDLAAAVATLKYSWGHAGHDFWLTRNHHGAGYWDRELPDGIGDRLTTAAQECDGRNALVGDDGSIYVE